MPIQNVGIAAAEANAPLAPWKYTIRDLREDDVKIEIMYCGICHSDIHNVLGEWSHGKFPMVPGHEFVGIVMEVGSKVTKFNKGDHVGVGVMVHSCQECVHCKNGKEQFCDHWVESYGSVMPDGEITYGGYGKYTVVEERFVLRIPDNLPLEKAAPLLCAGITTFSPCNSHNFQRGGLQVGVVGLGGLGHMAVQWAKAMGNEVTVVTRTLKKSDMAKKLGAAKVVASSDQEQMAAAAGTLDYIIDTVSAEKPINDYLNLLAPEGTLISVGLPPVNDPLQVAPFRLIMGNKCIRGSNIGGVAETQQMLNFASEHNILPWVEEITGADVNTAYKRVVAGDVAFRFVINCKATHADAL